MSTRACCFLVLASLGVLPIVGCNPDNPPADGGPGDAGPADAFREPRDAFRPPRDGFREDGFVPPDAQEVDAFVDVDAFVEMDAFVEVDAFVEPDAFVEVDAFVPPDAFTGDAGPACSTPCSDGNPCNGVETCVAGTCMPGTPLDCADGMACTADSCNMATGCVNTPLNADGDADNACVDCNDANPMIHSGATELCNSIDDNCNGATDEGASATQYADCDGDMWAPTTAITATGCTPPPVADTGCGTATQAWTTRVPTDDDNDCADDDTRAHSTVTAFQTTPIASAIPELDFDFNCDFVEEPQFPAAGSCTAGAGGACTLVMGWMGAVPECGDSALFITGCAPVTCTAIPMSRTQGCR